jgi:putative SOS response-associated peptidase YedK
MCNLYSVTTNQAAIIALFHVVNRYVGNLTPMPGVFFDYPAPVIRNTAGTEMVTMRWGMPPPPRTGGPPVTNNLATLRSSIGAGVHCSSLSHFPRRAAEQSAAPLVCFWPHN